MDPNLTTTITPCRTLVTERFPVASFVVRVPAARCFELAYATDPRLFSAAQAHERTPTNFFATREEGLLRAPAGQVTCLIPSQQLARFAGATRLYYAGITYGDATGRDPQPSITPDRLNEVPCIRIAPDFTGRSLARRRFGGSAPAADDYASTPRVLRWGGDLVWGRHGAESAAPAHSETLTAACGRPDYDDGFDASLWHQAPRQAPHQASSSSSQRPGAHEEYGQVAAHSTNDDSVSSSTEPAGVEHPAECRNPRQVALSTTHGAALGVAPYQPQSTARAAEPPGLEHPDPLQYGTVAGPNSGSTPAPGPRATQSALGTNRAYGGAAAVLARQMDTASDPDARLPGYGDPSEIPAHLMRPVSVASQAASDSRQPARVLNNGPAPLPLTIPEKFRIVVAVAQFECGLLPEHLDDSAARARAYGAANRNSDGAGLSWGLIQFTQRGGMLGRVLQACARRNRALLAQIFAPHLDDVLRVTTADTEEQRVQPVDSEHLWTERWVRVFQRAAQELPFQAAQNEVAIERFLDPNLPFASSLGFNTDRALAMLFDRCIQQGNGGGRAWILEQVSPLRTSEDRDRAVLAVGASDLRSFQQQHGGLVVDGRWGPFTHAALLGALRERGSSTGFDVASRDAMLQRIVEGARSRSFAHRPQRLHADRVQLTDAVYLLS